MRISFIYSWDYFKHKMLKAGGESLRPSVYVWDILCGGVARWGEDTHHYISSNINSVKTPHLCLRQAQGIAAEAFLLTGFCAAITECPNVLSPKYLLMLLYLLKL